MGRAAFLPRGPKTLSRLDGLPAAVSPLFGFALLLFAGLLLAAGFLRCVLCEADGHGGQRQRESQHKAHHFLQVVLVLRSEWPPAVRVFPPLIIAEFS